MSGDILQKCRVLLVEDDFLIADDFARRLNAAGAEVIGPAPTLATALALYEASDKLDFVILDINLRGTAVFPLAHRLHRDGVPFLFCTGYGDGPIRDDFSTVPRFEKPISQNGFSAMIDLIFSSRDGSAALSSYATERSAHLPM